MTQRAVWIGMVATGAMMLVMLAVALREPARLDEAREDQRTAALARGIEVYAFNCAECHGSRGQGEVQEDATELSDDYMRSREGDWLYKAIARGRDDTEMAAFHVDEGGALNRQQIESLVTVIKHAEWENVAVHVADLGMISEEEHALADVYAHEEAMATLPMIMVAPTQAPVDATATASDDTLPVVPIAATDSAPDSAVLTPTGVSLPAVAVVPTATGSEAASLPSVAIQPTSTPHNPVGSSLPMIAVQPTASTTGGDRGSAYNLYTLHCADCHGASGGGVDDMPALNTARVQAMSRRELGQISFGNPAIEGHDVFLLPDEQVALIDFMHYAFAQGD